MPERLIPISKKQHDAINTLTAGIQQAQGKLETMASTLLMAVDEELGKVNVLGAVCTDGVYALKIDVPDIAPKAGESSAVSA